jgi:hypothetical protein
MQYQFSTVHGCLVHGCLIEEVRISRTFNRAVRFNVPSIRNCISIAIKDWDFIITHFVLCPGASSGYKLEGL